MKTPFELLIQAMISEGWATSSSGEVDAPTGAFALILNEEGDIFEISLAFASLISTFDIGEVDNLYRELVGYFTVVENDLGQVQITSHVSTATAGYAFRQLERRYDGWNANGNNATA